MSQVNFALNVSPGLQAAELTLDYRVTNLEENSGGTDNIIELERRVSDLEVTNGEQETRITTNQEDIEGEDWRDICGAKYKIVGFAKSGGRKDDKEY